MCHKKIKPYNIIFSLYLGSIALEHIFFCFLDFQLFALRSSSIGLVFDIFKIVQGSSKNWECYSPCRTMHCKLNKLGLRQCRGSIIKNANKQFSIQQNWPISRAYPCYPSNQYDEHQTVRNGFISLVNCHRRFSYQTYTTGVLCV